MKLNIAKLTASFAPSFFFSKAYKHLRIYGGVDLNNDALYEKVKELTALAEPYFHDRWDTTWKFFYLPMKRNGRMICSPFLINLHRGKSYTISFYGFTNGLGYHAVEKGNDVVPDYYFQMLDETLRFIPLIKEYGDPLIERIFPFDWRTGLIKRKYTNPGTLMSAEEAEKIKAAYQKHLDKKLKVTEISLNDYLNTAAICYHAAFESEIKRINKELPPKELIKYWADNRHGGMWFLEDPDSNEEYTGWLKSDEWNGAHPFEIVYSTPHGIYLYPPEADDFFRLSVADPYYNGEFVKMATALMEHNIPFETRGLDEALKYLTGDNDMEVNTGSMRNPTFKYETSKLNRKLFLPHIRWDPVQSLKWK